MSSANADWNGKHVLVTGGAGFIGSHVADVLLARGARVTVFDDFSTGFREFIAPARENLRVVEGDLLDQARIGEAMRGVDFVFHLAANADIKDNLAQPRKCIDQNVVVTQNVLEAMRAAGAREIVFASTGSVYGETDLIPTPENAPFPVQTSLYAASKLAAEAMIEAYCEGFGMEGHIFRFVSILGERYTHGHILDFYKQLREHSGHLDILGDGRQRKSYLYVQDCVDALLLAIERGAGRLNLYNLGTDEYCTVNDSIGWIAERLGCAPRLNYAGGERGWVGDSPFIFLDCSRIRALGWRPRLSIREAVVRTVDYLRGNSWVIERR